MGYILRYPSDQQLACFKNLGSTNWYSLVRSNFSQCCFHDANRQTLLLFHFTPTPWKVTNAFLMGWFLALCSPHGWLPFWPAASGKHRQGEQEDVWVQSVDIGLWLWLCFCSSLSQIAYCIGTLIIFYLGKSLYGLPPPDPYYFTLETG